MGKYMLISGADFSENSIGQVDVPSDKVNITPLFNVTRSKTSWNSSAGTHTAGNLLETAVDISNYIVQGFSRIKITCLSGKWTIRAYKSDKGASDFIRYTSTGNDWATTSNEADIDPLYPNLCVAIQTADQSALPTDISGVVGYLKIELL